MAEDDTADFIEHALREWDDLPLCVYRSGGVASPGWTSTTRMAVDFVPAECSLECGKRLNRSVTMVFRHCGLADRCLSLFTGPGLEIDVAKLRGFSTAHRQLFSEHADSVFSKGSSDDCFTAQKCGLVVLGLNVDDVQHGLSIARTVVDMSLKSWLFTCERATLPPLSPTALSISISSPSELARALQRRPHALILSCGTQAVSFDAFDEQEVDCLRLLVLIGCHDVPSERVAKLMRRRQQLIVCWHAVNLPAAVDLARAFPERVSLQSPFDTDKDDLRNELFALGFDRDESVVATLIGTHLSTVPLRLSAIYNLK
jgi:hypothetical protein